MSFSARYATAVFVAVFSLAVSVCAQSTTTQTTKTSRGSISGRVTIKDKGAPGVAIGLRTGDVGFPYDPFQKTTTDVDGYYRLNNVSPGTYEITPSAPAYVIGENNSQRTKSVIVGEDENVDGINFSLVRGGVITGKVTDADGRPLILQQVYLYRIDPSQQQPGAMQPVFASSATLTDDRGIYRVYGLAAGSYKVASGRSEDGYYSPSPLSRSSYKRVFHPDATEESRATAIVVTEGSEANNVDIAMGRPQQTFSASGKVIDGEKGMPLPNVRFALQRSTGPRLETVPGQIMSNVKGDFFIEGLTPGKYGVYVFQTPSQPYPDMRAESVMFEIVDQDLTNLTVRLTKGASLSGVVVLDSEDKAAIQKFQQLQLRVILTPTPREGPVSGQLSTATIAPDGSFRVGGLSAGTANLSMNGARPINVKGFIISRVERDGVLTSPRGVELKEGEQVTGIRVTVAYGSASIRGVVKFENGSMPPDRLFIRLMKSGETVSNLPFVRVDARGHFLIEALPAGVYELEPMGAPGRRGKQEVTVQEGMVTDVVITIDLGTTPK